MAKEIKKLSRKEVVDQISKITNLFHRIPKAKKTKKVLEKKENPSSLQEMIDYLRVCVKYTIYDLEATRRENKLLKKALEE